MVGVTKKCKLFRNVISIVVLVLLLSTLTMTAFAYGGDTHSDDMFLESTVSLTSEEQEYLKEHPTVVMAADASWRPLEYVDNEQYTGVIAEITQRIEEYTGLNSAMINRIQKDSLTGLYCKDFFKNKVDDILKHNETTEYDLIYIGITCFKMINDAYGTCKGNEILKFIGDSITDLCPEGSLCARFYADNFFIFTEHADFTEKNFQPILEQIKKCPVTPDIRIQCGILSNIDAVLEVEGMCDRAEMAGKANVVRYSTAPFTFYSETLSDRMKNE